MVNKASTDLATILSFFSDNSNLQPIAQLICPVSQPAIDNPMRLVPPEQWTGRDWLHWKHPGKFATKLRDDAMQWTKTHPGDNRFFAYAVGWQVAYAALVCGSGFINSIAGSVYRTLWWRHRWMQLFVDTWSWGFYGAHASMNPDTDLPEPPFDQWPALCKASLHSWIDLTGGLDPLTVALSVVIDNPTNPLPQPLPDDFVTFWLEAWTAAYSNPISALFTESRLQAGYIMTWLQLWFQTSGDVIGCNPPPSPTPPPTCGNNTNPPNWVDPTKINPATCKPDGSGCQLFKPETPTPKHEPDVGEIICGIIAALMGAATLSFGGGIVGTSNIVAGISLIVGGEKQLNWDELSCQLYWLSVYIFNGLSALHKLTVLAGIQHPYPADLAEMNQTLAVGNQPPISFPSVGTMCKSLSVQSTLVPWNCGLLDWTQPPSNVSSETPPSMVWSWPGWWPNAFIDDVETNRGGADIAVAPATYNAGVKQTFGPSVQAAMRLITAPPAKLPDWNLDGDRGIGWLTWKLQTPYSLPLNSSAEG
jgi:hypothetical protein